MDNMRGKKERKNARKLSEDERLRRRAEANRKSSAQARQRQRDEMITLKRSKENMAEKIASVKRDNVRLREELSRKRNELDVDGSRSTFGDSYQIGPRAFPVYCATASHAEQAILSHQEKTFFLSPPKVHPSLNTTHIFLSTPLSTPVSLTLEELQNELRQDLSSIACAPQLSVEEISREWDVLSRSEKEDAMNDVCGTKEVGPPKTAPQEMEVRGLALMELELEKIPRCDKASFVEALQRCPEMASSREEKLQFLRCVDFDPKLASRRLVHYWDSKVELFGRHHAFEPLTIKTVLASDERELMSGYFRVLPGVDSFGRGLLYNEHRQWYKGIHRVDSMVRVLWYLIRAALSNDSVRLHGIVIVSCFIDVSFDHYVQDLYPKYAQLIRECFPVKIRAIHWCHFPVNQWFSPGAVRLGKFLMGPKLRARLRVHMGSIATVLLKLGRFGISSSSLTTTMGGCVTLDDFLSWVSYKKLSDL